MARTSHRIGKIVVWAALTCGTFGAVQAMSPRDDQAIAREAANSGTQMSLAAIVAMVQSQSQFRNLTFLGGAEYNERTKSYRLKFMDGKRVVFVDVDARNGKILSNSR